ncbi:chemotaxis protein CheA [Alkalitalea saponilacus]|uniref:Chemotaxis protein CheA n=1 Tax=Alkalitalea saponilacus TaxID=889453 RepID=A0A1T5ED09_9BACT|nr:chemotaxis protein CheA [Alkalitalea saponilacus]ASB49029.1 chemotaxis protein CheA [Alkalitalea saponilacus]SKB81786.1 two-component system, chemotaxis family, sensor kinase CheA [Alkalitalea saponilacus]
MLDKFKAKFVEESMDNLQDLEESLFLLEKDLENKELIERIFRAMHSLKGGGAMFGFNHLSDFTHHLETIFDWVRNNKLAVTSDLITLTFSAIDHIKNLIKTGDLTDEQELKGHNQFILRLQSVLSDSASTLSVHSTVDSQNINDEISESKTYLINFIPQEELLQNGTNPLYLLDDIHALGEAISIAYTHKVPSLELIDITANYCLWQILLNTSESLNEIKDVFIFVEDECELQIDLIADSNILQKPECIEIIKKARKGNSLLKIEDFQSLSQLKPSSQELESGEEKKKITAIKEHKISSIRVASHKIDELVTLVSELVTIQAQLSLYSESNEDPVIVSLSENIQKLSRQLRENAFDISLIPLQSELMRFQRLVRDLSKDQGKDIDFVIEGGDLELDKNIIEHLTDPLLHILRNSIDHGIELPEERISSGKSPKGTILFKAFHSGANVIIEVSDDGKGMDLEYIRQKAISKEIVDQNAVLTDKEVLDLLFVSGFSTKDAVSDVSGRGVGMDVVRRKIANIRGEVSIDTEKGKGTTITIRLPLTLSIIDGLLVKVGANQYVIPISAIDKIHALDPSQLKKSFNNVVVLDKEQIPYIDLRKVFNAPEVEHDVIQMVMIKAEDRITGVIVDSVIGEYQTVVKPLGRYLKKQEILSGATIMGDGTLAMVVDTSRLLMERKSKKVAG